MAMNIENRKARYLYEITDTLDVGLVLVGSEVKALRVGKASLQESYCFFKKGELFIKSFYIAPYVQADAFAPSPLRVRKLLLHRTEIKKWERRVKEKGCTVVPLKLFFTKQGLAKLQIGLAKGKKKYDKRQQIKAREDERTMARVVKKRYV